MRHHASDTDVESLRVPEGVEETRDRPDSEARATWALSERAWQLVCCYQEVLEPLLRDEAADRADELAHVVARIREAGEEAAAPASVCMLGQAGVGKSTLLNTVVAGSQVVLPQGGIGPLTAQATKVQYAPTPTLIAEYHKADRLNQLIFALGYGQKNRPRDDTEGDEPDAKHAEYLRQAKLLVKGNAHAQADERYLFVALRAALGENALPIDLEPEDRKRIERIREALAMVKAGERYERSDDGTGSFRDVLKDHASGFLAPLIRRLDVKWPSPTLQKGFELVDLPGLGVANDAFRKVTQEHVRGSARGIILVVDRNGLLEETADILRQSGFWNRLLHSLDDPLSDPVSLHVAITRLDLQADDRRREEKQSGAKPRPFREHLREVFASARAMVEQGLHEQLAAFASDAPELADARRQAINLLFDNLEIHPVVPLEYARLIEDDEDEPPRIRAAEESGVPGLTSALEELAADRRARFEQRQELLVRQLVRQSEVALHQLERRWRHREPLSQEAVQKLEAAKQQVGELRRELHLRQGSFREYLNEGVHANAQTAIEKACTQARKEASTYLGKLQGRHWRQLQAAVRRNGKYRDIVDLPNELALRIEEPLAILWSSEILENVKRRTTDAASTYRSVVGDVKDVLSTSGLSDDLGDLDTLCADLDEDPEFLDDFGHELVARIRSNVRAKLHGELEKAIAAACERFFRASEDRGAGVKDRIVELFQKLSEQCVEVARDPAKSVFDSALTDLRERLGKWLVDQHRAVGQVLDAYAPEALAEAAEEERREKLAEIQRALAQVAALRQPPAAA